MEDESQQKMIDPEMIVAIVSTHPNPQPVISPGKIYKVLSYRKNKKHDDRNHTYFFNVRGGSGSEVEVFVDLDDDEFLLFSESDLEQVRT